MRATIRIGEEMLCLPYARFFFNRIDILCDVCMYVYFKDWKYLLDKNKNYFVFQNISGYLNKIIEFMDICWGFLDILYFFY